VIDAPELIAEVVADLRAGRVYMPAAIDSTGVFLSKRCLARAQLQQPVVDCTSIFNRFTRGGPVSLFEDHPEITPPWPDALLAFANHFGNAIVLQVHSYEWDGRAPAPNDWYTDEDINWPRVRWIAETSIFAGGGTTNSNQPLGTVGPCHLLRHAIRDDGGPEDINWVALMAEHGRRGTAEESDDPNKDTWMAATATLGASLNFLNCANVEVAEPRRPRPQRRRLERTGVTVQTIVVRPPGKRSNHTNSSEARPMDALDTPISPVRGHAARYGPKYDRGLLFGKHEGKFWIPGHVRNARNVSNDQTPVRDYTLKPTGDPR
jgi:hypothetical protein